VMAVAVAVAADRQGHDLAGPIGQRIPPALDFVGQLAQAAAARKSAIGPPGHRDPADDLVP
jgi:hypothetical protein